MKILRRYSVLVLSMLLLTACNFLQPREQGRWQEYSLDTLPADLPTAPSSGLTLLVSAPRAEPEYDTRAMLYQRHPHQLEAFAQHRWADKPSGMLQGLLLEALADTGAFSAVVSPSNGAAADWRLETEILALRQDFPASGPSTLHLKVRVALLDHHSRQVLTEKLMTLDEPAGTGPETGVAAANRAVAVLLQRISALCLEQISTHAAPVRKHTAPTGSQSPPHAP